MNPVDKEVAELKDISSFHTMEAAAVINSGYPKYLFTIGPTQTIMGPNGKYLVCSYTFYDHYAALRKAVGPTTEIYYTVLVPTDYSTVFPDPLGNQETYFEFSYRSYAGARVELIVDPVSALPEEYIAALENFVGPIYSRLK